MASVTTNISIAISHSPRLNKKPDNSFFVFLWVIKNAEVPARKRKIGAQKWVIQRVKNNAGNVVAILVGLSPADCALPDGL